MDFPIALETMDFVEDYAAKKQEIEICLRQSRGTILQDWSRGSDVSVHINSLNMLYHSVETVMLKIADIKLHSVKVVGDEILIWYTYQGKVEKVILDSRL